MATQVTAFEQMDTTRRVGHDRLTQLIKIRTAQLKREPQASRLESAHTTKDLQRLAILATCDSDPQVLLAAVNRRLLSIAVLNYTAENLSILAMTTSTKVYRPVALAVLDDPNANENTFLQLAKFKDVEVQRALLGRKDLPKRARLLSERLFEALSTMLRVENQVPAYSSPS